MVAASRIIYYDRFTRYPHVFPTTPSIREQMDILKGTLDHSMAYGISEIVIVNNWHGDKHGNPAGWHGMKTGDHFRWTLWTLWLSQFSGHVLLQLHVCGNQVAANMMKEYVQILERPGGKAKLQPPEGNAPEVF